MLLWNFDMELKRAYKNPGATRARTKQTQANALVSDISAYGTN